MDVGYYDDIIERLDSINVSVCARDVADDLLVELACRVDPAIAAAYLRVIRRFSGQWPHLWEQGGDTAGR
jgi:hypothetical protein